MKKAIIILIMLLCVVRNPIIVFAGSLNENESAIVAVAQGEFEYNGVKYRAGSGYINDLINYLCQDDVNLTSGQKNTAIQKIYANVQKGVSEGYLIPVEQNNSTQIDSGSEEDSSAEDANTEDSKTEDSKTKDTKSENTMTQDAKSENTKLEDSNTKNSKPEGTDTVNINTPDSNAASNYKTADSNNIDEKNGKNQGDSSAEKDDFLADIVGDSEDVAPNEEANTSETSSDIKDITKIKNATSTIVDKKNCTIRVVNENDESLLTVNTTIKNTGFNIIQTIIVLVIVVTVLLISIVVAIRQIYFARMNE